jgi:hypothetical protein
MYGKYVKGQSPQDKIAALYADFLVSQSKQLKHMREAVLEEQAASCYPEKWMSESFSNAEQVAICKQEAHDKVFGKFEAEVKATRQSSSFKYQDCEVAAGNNVMKYVHCLRDFQANIANDNKNLQAFMKQNYSEYN